MCTHMSSQGPQLAPARRDISAGGWYWIGTKLRSPGGARSRESGARWCLTSPEWLGAASDWSTAVILLLARLSVLFASVATPLENSLILWRSEPLGKNAARAGSQLCAVFGATLKHLLYMQLDKHTHLPPRVLRAVQMHTCVAAL